MATDLMLFEGERVLLDYPAQSSQIYANMIGSVIATLFFVSFMVFFCTIFFGTIFQILVVHNNQMSGFHPQRIVAIILIISFFLIILSYFSLISSIARSRYVFTNQRCLIIRGIGFKGVDKRSIPYGRIANVNISQGFIQSFYGIADVYIDEQVMGMQMRNMPQNTRNMVSGVTMEQADNISRLISEHVSKKS